MKDRGKPSEVIGKIGMSGYLIYSSGTVAKNGTASSSTQPASSAKVTK